MGLSIDGLAKTLPLPAPAPPASADDDATGFGQALDAASAKIGAAPVAPPATSPPAADSEPPLDENLPIRNYPQLVKMADGRQAVAGHGKDAPSDDEDRDQSTKKVDDGKTILAVPPWVVFVPPPPTAQIASGQPTTAAGTTAMVAVRPAGGGDHAPASPAGTASVRDAKTAAPAVPVVPTVDGTIARLAATPGLVVPIARVPLPQPADVAPSAPVAAPIPARPDPTVVAPMTGGALAAAAVHAATANSGGQGGSDHGRHAPGAVDATDLTGAPPPLAAATVPTAPAPGPAAAAADAVLDTRDPAWMATLVDKMVEARDASGSRSITMTLRPDALGAVEISLRHSAGQLHVVFTAADAGARSLLGDARSQLATLAADRGVDLGSATVSGGGSGPTDGSAGRQPDQRSAATPSTFRWPRAATDEAQPESPSSARMIRERTA